MSTQTQSTPEASASEPKASQEGTTADTINKLVSQAKKLLGKEWSRPKIQEALQLNNYDLQRTIDYCYEEGKSHVGSGERWEKVPERKPKEKKKKDTRKNGEGRGRGRTEGRTEGGKGRGRGRSEGGKGRGRGRGTRSGDTEDTRTRRPPRTDKDGAVKKSSTRPKDKPKTDGAKPETAKAVGSAKSDATKSDASKPDATKSAPAKSAVAKTNPVKSTESTKPAAPKSTTTKLAKPVTAAPVLRPAESGQPTEKKSWASIARGAQSTPVQRPAPAPAPVEEENNEEDNQDSDESPAPQPSVSFTKKDRAVREWKSLDDEPVDKELDSLRTSEEADSPVISHAEPASHKPAHVEKHSEPKHNTVHSHSGITRPVVLIGDEADFAEESELFFSFGSAVAGKSKAAAKEETADVAPSQSEPAVHAPTHSAGHSAVHSAGHSSGHPALHPGASPSSPPADSVSTLPPSSPPTSSQPTPGSPTQKRAQPPHDFRREMEQHMYMMNLGFPGFVPGAGLMPPMPTYDPSSVRGPIPPMYDQSYAPRGPPPAVARHGGYKDKYQRDAKEAPAPTSAGLAPPPAGLAPPGFPSVGYHVPPYYQYPAQSSFPPFMPPGGYPFKQPPHFSYGPHYGYEEPYAAREAPSKAPYAAPPGSEEVSASHSDGRATSPYPKSSGAPEYAAPPRDYYKGQPPYGAGAAYGTPYYASGPSRPYT